jgi:hypothetical protein
MTAFGGPVFVAASEDTTGPKPSVQAAGCSTNPPGKLQSWNEKFFYFSSRPLLATAQNLKEFEKKVTESPSPTAPLHRHRTPRSPVVSFNTYVKAGSLNDPNGQTGLAHMFEHMAFKGTPWLGSRNWPEEKKALDEVEQISTPSLEEERRKDLRAATAQRIASLESRVKAAVDKAALYVDPNAYPRIVSKRMAEWD